MGKDISRNFQSNSLRKETYYKNTGIVIRYEFYHSQSELIIDETDKVLAEHYGLKEGELDFIINYDIKHRMGKGGGDE